MQSVTIEKDGNSYKMFIEANPQFKNVTLYDSNLKLVAKESLEQYKSGIDKGSKVLKEHHYDWIKHGKLKRVKIRSRVYFLGSDIRQLMQG